MREAIEQVVCDLVPSSLSGRRNAQVVAVCLQAANIAASGRRPCNLDRRFTGGATVGAILERAGIAIPHNPPRVVPAPYFDLSAMRATTPTPPAPREECPPATLWRPGRDVEPMHHVAEIPEVEIASRWGTLIAARTVDQAGNLRHTVVGCCDGPGGAPPYLLRGDVDAAQQAILDEYAGRVDRYVRRIYQNPALRLFGLWPPFAHARVARASGVPSLFGARI